MRVTHATPDYISFLKCKGIGRQCGPDLVLPDVTVVNPDEVGPVPVFRPQRYFDALEALAEKLTEHMAAILIEPPDGAKVADILDISIKRATARKGEKHADWSDPVASKARNGAPSGTAAPTKKVIPENAGDPRGPFGKAQIMSILGIPESMFQDRLNSGEYLQVNRQNYMVRFDLCSVHDKERLNAFLNPRASGKRKR